MSLNSAHYDRVRPLAPMRQHAIYHCDEWDGEIEYQDTRWLFHTTGKVWDNDGARSNR